MLTKHRETAFYLFLTVNIEAVLLALEMQRPKIVWYGWRPYPKEAEPRKREANHQASPVALSCGEQCTLNFNTHTNTTWGAH